MTSKRIQNVVIIYVQSFRNINKNVTKNYCVKYSIILNLAVRYKIGNNSINIVD